MPPLTSPLPNNKFTLNTWGVAGIFGGEEAISAVALIPLYQSRRWFGWYNSPGSLEVARRFGNLARSHFWERLFPHMTKSPAALFGFDGKVGPKYTAALSGTEMQTGHLGYLAIERCKEIVEGVIEIPGRITTPADVALINVGNVDHDHNVSRLSRYNAFLALIPITVSVVTCVMCALVHDWYSFSVIIFGILASGLASIAIGSGELDLKSVNPAPGSPPGDGILVPVIWEDIVVVVKGAEKDVNAITKGKFRLVLPGSGLARHAIGVCSLLLILEFLAQLLLIPQGTLFGQLMFVISLCVSWVYNYYISSFRRETLQGNVLFEKLGNPQIRKFYLGTRTAMAVFVALLVFHEVPNPSPLAVQKILRTLLPNDTFVWDKWRKRVAFQVCDRSLSCLKLDEEGDDGDLVESDRELLGNLLHDASTAYDGYLHYFTANNASTGKQG